MGVAAHRLLVEELFVQQRQDRAVTIGLEL